MKKIKKTGLSIAEVLIALVIIGVVSAMGVTIADKGMERAYNMAFYTGYDGLYKALAESSKNGGNIVNRTQMQDPEGNNSTVIRLNETFSGNFADALNIPNDDVTVNQGNMNQYATFRAPNNIEYTIIVHDGNDLNYTDANGQSYAYYQVEMRVPTLRDRNNLPTTTNFVYIPDFQGGLLIPIQGNGYILNDPAGGGGNIPHNYVDLTTRQDLLPFYIDNGTDGKVRIGVDINGNPVNAPQQFNPRNFMSAQGAFCQLYGPLTLSANTGFGCGGVNNVGQSRGLLRYENPKKAF